MLNTEHSYTHDLEQIKATITSKRLWPAVLSKYPQYSEALANLGKHVTCPFHGGEGNFRLFDDNSAKSAATCSCGNYSFVDLVLQAEGKTAVDMDVVKMLAEFAGMDAAEPVKPLTKDKAAGAGGSRYPAYALSQSRPVDGIALTYLQSRGLSSIAENLPDAIRCLSDAEYQTRGETVFKGDCLVAKCTYPDGDLAGIIRIFLSPEGSKADIQDSNGKAVDPKPMAGQKNGRQKPLKGSAVRMPGQGSIEHVGEGIETMLSVKSVLPEPVAACGTAALLSGFEPSPEAKAVIVWSDKDKSGTGQKHASKLVDKLREQGIPAVMVVPPYTLEDGAKGVDWLDVFNHKDGAEVIKKTYTEAREKLSALAEELKQEKKPAKEKPVIEAEQPISNDPLLNMEAYRLVARLEQTKTSELPIKSQVISQIREALNNDFCMAYMGSKAVLIEQYTKTENRPFKATAISTAGYYDFLKAVPYQAQKKNLNDDVSIPVRKTVNVFQEWLGWTQANRKGVVVFDPSPNASERDYNLWTGYRAASFGIIQCDHYLDTWNEYLYNALAPGEKEAAEYIENWLAQMIQIPWFKPGVAVAAASKGKGTGKSILAEMVRNMIGKHYIRIFAKHQLIGQFTGHLADKMFANAEESCFVGDSAANNALKNLITSETQVVENKGKDAYEVDSFIRLYATSNEEHFVNASGDERRWLIVNNDKSQYKQNTDFFGKLAMSNNKTGEIHKDRIATLYNYLLTKDISDFDVRKVPETEAMRIQKELSASPMEMFHRYLISGEFESDRISLVGLGTVIHKSKEGKLWIKKDVFKDEFEYFQKSWHSSKRQYIAPNNMKRILNSVCDGFYSDKQAKKEDEPAIFNKRYWIFDTDYEE